MNASGKRISRALLAAASAVSSRDLGDGGVAIEEDRGRLDHGDANGIRFHVIISGDR